MSGRFTQNNQGFICRNCQADVPVAKSTSRNHCPFCLHSVHVDVFPGDRQNPCQGLMKPISYENRPKKGWSILFECLVCGQKGWNIALMNDPYAPDDYKEMLKLSGTYSCAFDNRRQRP
jgi:DNA-directed RNA polymerase subunit RPC12/RpoP